MAISFQKHGDLVYGTVCTVRRDGAKVIKEYGEQLGRVVDRERLVFFSRKHGGLFQYDEKTGKHLPAPDDLKVPARKSRLKGSVRPVSYSFGAVYLIDCLMKKNGLYDVIDASFADKSDSIKAMLCFYILSSLSNKYAEDWLHGNIGVLLFPKASLSSPQITSLLEYVGDLNRKQLFLLSYLEWFKKNCPHDKIGNILIDSTGLPSSVHFHLTAISNHNGDLNEEVRLIYVVQQSTGLPLFFRAIPGNIIDVTTIQRVLLELKALGLDITCAIADAGYYSDANIQALHNDNIAFLLRLQPNRTLYKDVVAAHLHTIKEQGVLVRQNNRLVRVKRVPCKLCKKLNSKGEIISQVFDGYAYLCLDEQRKAMDTLKLGERVSSDKLSIEEYDKAQEALGVFMLISSKPIDPKEVLAVYYTRQQIEQTFDLGKNYAGMLPLNIQKEETFNGHMMLTFIATIMVKMLQEKLRTTKTPIKATLELLEHHNCVKYGEKFITCEPNKKCRMAYEALGIEYPISVCIK